MKNFDEAYDLRVVKRDATGELAKDAKGEVILETIQVSRKARLSRDRSFVIGGETFTYRPSVAPESIKDWSRMQGGEFNLKEADGKPILDPEGNQISTLSEDEALRIFDRTVLAFLEPGQDEKWEAVRRPEVEVPLNLTDLQALIRWLFEEQSGRPTTPPSASSSGSANGGTSTNSTDESPSLVATG